MWGQVHSFLGPAVVQEGCSGNLSLQPLLLRPLNRIFCWSRRGENTWFSQNLDKDKEYWKMRWIPDETFGWRPLLCYFSYIYIYFNKTTSRVKHYIIWTDQSMIFLISLNSHRVSFDTRARPSHSKCVLLVTTRESAKCQRVQWAPARRYEDFPPPRQISGSPLDGRAFQIYPVAAFSTTDIHGTLPPPLAFLHPSIKGGEGGLCWIPGKANKSWMGQIPIAAAPAVSARAAHVTTVLLCIVPRTMAREV